MQSAVRWCRRKHAQAGRGHRTAVDFVFGGFSHVEHFQVKAKCDAGQRVIAVEHHVGGIHLGDRVDGVLREALCFCAGRRAFELHAGLDVLLEDAAVLEKDEFGFVVAESVFRFEVELGGKARLLPQQGLLDLGEQVAASDKKFHRGIEFVDQVALGVFESPGEADDAGCGNEHRPMIAQSGMDILKPVPLLGAMSPETFMRTHWQKKPLLVRQAVPGGAALQTRAELFGLAGREGVESRLIVHDESGWTLRHGPIPRRALPKVDQPRWTVLVQGVDLHVEAAHALLSQFRFVPDARLDDLMISWASDGGGVGPHVDSYDVFLLQVQGRRRWRIGRLRDATLVPGVPLRILQNFEPEEEWLLEPGDMLYLPPGWAHDGVAEGECMTASIGFRAPPKETLGREVLQRMLDAAEEPEQDVLYEDQGQPATSEPGRIPAGLRAFAADAVARLVNDSQALDCAMGELLTEPKPDVWFEPADALPVGAGVQLDRRTRMMYDDRHVFINGESFIAGGDDARLMRCLADDRRLVPEQVGQLSEDARDLLDAWVEAGWAVPE